jgi:hypothetical protein
MYGTYKRFEMHAKCFSEDPEVRSHLENESVILKWSLRMLTGFNFPFYPG